MLCLVLLLAVFAGLEGSWNGKCATLLLSKYCKPNTGCEGKAQDATCDGRFSISGKCSASDGLCQACRGLSKDADCDAGATTGFCLTAGGACMPKTACFGKSVDTACDQAGVTGKCTLLGICDACKGKSAGNACNYRNLVGNAGTSEGKCVKPFILLPNIVCKSTACDGKSNGNTCTENGVDGKCLASVCVPLGPCNGKAKDAVCGPSDAGKCVTAGGLCNYCRGKSSGDACRVLNDASGGKCSSASICLPKSPCEGKSNGDACELDIGINGGSTKTVSFFVIAVVLATVSMLV